MTYRLTPRARRGLQRIILYAEGRFGATIAARILDRLVAAFEQLATHAESGHRRHELTDADDIRFWSVGPTLIAYRHRVEGPEILLVERGDLDWERLLEDEL